MDLMHGSKTLLDVKMKPIYLERLDSQFVNFLTSKQPKYKQHKNFLHARQPNLDQNKHAVKFNTTSTTLKGDS